MTPVYIIGGLRTPIGIKNGQLKDFLPRELAAEVLAEIIAKYNLAPTEIDEVIMGNAVGPGGNLARLSLLAAKWPVNISGTTIDYQCGGGLKAINLAASLIKSKQKDLVIAGGVESTSLKPERKLNQNHPDYSPENKHYTKATFAPDWLGDPGLPKAAEKAARFKKIPRSKMDQWALISHKRASKVQKKGYLDKIILPLSRNNKKIKQDEGIRKNLSVKLLQRLNPIVYPQGRITPGNCCLKHDGAASILLASKQAVKKYNLTPQAVIKGSVSIGINPNLAPLAPIPATKTLLEQHQISASQIGAIEINEAFAVKVLAYLQELDFTPQQINRWGGALAYGHPYGASGAIILLHLLARLNQNNFDYGLATLGVAGGLGVATLIKNYQGAD